MPNYVFKHPEKEEYEEVFFHMKDEPKTYIDPEGIEWGRVFEAPQLNTIGKIDPWSNNDFVNKTRDKKGSVGDLLDASSELSAKELKKGEGLIR